MAAGISKRKDGLGMLRLRILFLYMFLIILKYKNNISYYIDFSHLQQNHVLNLVVMVVEVCGLLFGPSEPVRKGLSDHQHPPAMNHQ